MMKFRMDSFFVKVIAGFVLLLLLLGLANIVQTRALMNTLFAEQQEKRGISLASTLAARAANLIIIHNYYDLHELVKDTQSTNDDARYVFVVSHSGELLAHSFPTGFPTDLLQVSVPSGTEKYRINVLATEEGSVRDIAVPILDGRLGVVHVGLSADSLQKILQDTTHQFLFDTLIALLIGFGLAFFFTQRLTRPIRELARAASAITAGDLTQRAHIGSQDEIGKFASAFNAMADHVHALLNELKQKEEARTHLLQKVIVAQEEERKRISRELHDQTGQNLTSLMMRLKCLEDDCPSASRQCRLDEMRGLVKCTVEDIHRLAVELRPSILDDRGLVAALEKYVEDYRANYGLDVDFHVNWQGEERLAHEVEVTVYRIVQEALTNIVKYAVAANVSVILTATVWELTAIIEDDGIGFDAARLLAENAGGSKLGLYGMRERALLVGGNVTIESSPAIGTTIYVKIPLRRNSHE